MVWNPGEVLPRGSARATPDAAPALALSTLTYRIEGEGRRARSRLILAGRAEGTEGVEGVVPAFSHDPVIDLSRVLRPDPRSGGGGWIGWFGYALGHHLDGAIAGRARAGEPLAELHRFEDLVSIGRGGAGWVKAWRVAPAGVPEGGRYRSSVGEALRLIRAGDIYQANLAHRMEMAFEGDALALYLELARRAGPRYGMFVESAGGGGEGEGERTSVLSLSPELFLRFDARTRRLATRPMKGTRPGHADPEALRDSTKDRAELDMIVDLMRNDLGRVCELGSVVVDRPRVVERHGVGEGAVWQATAEVSGIVRAGLGAGEILAATFPPGSVTGAPKVRATEVIDGLEEFARGPYCGAIGVFGDDGSFTLAVAIRTAVVRGKVDGTGRYLPGSTLEYCVGAGIVADSDEEAEWEETLDKARVLAPVLPLTLPTAGGGARRAR